MLQVYNSTPFESGIAVLPDPQGIDTLYVRLKATFELGNKPTIAEKQVPLQYGDVYWGDPGKSSLRYPADMLLAKPSTDVLLLGEACLPDKKPAEQVDVSVEVGKQKKVVRVFGDRVWTGASRGTVITAPKPFESIPLVFERAFGGVLKKGEGPAIFESRNPVGKGLVESKRLAEFKGTQLPNLENPHDLLKKPGHQPSPASFGPAAPSWDPRKSFSGTYDEAWEKTRAPYLPQDFDSQFFNTAHPDLQFNPYLKGGEPVEIMNASPRGVIRFSLPICQFHVGVRKAGIEEKLQPFLETILFEPSVPQFYMVWCGTLPCDKSALKIERVDIGIKDMDVENKKNI